MSVVKQTVIVSTDSQVFLQKLKALDLGPIAYQLMHPNSGLGWTRSQTIQAIARYLMFLNLVHLYPNRQIVPTWEIDQVWHYHILDTSKYAADCQMLFGRFLHHFPYFGLRGEQDQQSLQMAFAQTTALFQEYFGEVNAIVDSQFQQPADCEPIGVLTIQNRPRINVEVADVFHAYLDYCCGQCQEIPNLL